MAHPMTDEERRAFLLHGTRTAIVSTVRADGRPHAAPVWFTLDGDDIIFNTGAGTVKGRNLARTGLAALTVDDAEPPFGFVTMGGTVELADNPPEVTELDGRELVVSGFILALDPSLRQLNLAALDQYLALRIIAIAVSAIDPWSIPGPKVKTSAPLDPRAAAPPRQ